MKKTNKIQGVLAEFANPEELQQAARRLHEAGYRQFELFSPFPINRLAALAGDKPSRVSFIAGLMALIGFGAGWVLQWWMNGIDYPHVVSGKPFISYQAYVPIIFALSVLLAAFGAVLGLLVLMRFRYHFYTFNSSRFPKFSDDSFFAGIEASDPQFDPQGAQEFLRDLGATNIELLEGE